MTPSGTRQAGGEHEAGARNRRLIRGLAAGLLGTAALALSDQVERLLLDGRPIYSPGRIGRRLVRRHFPGYRPGPGTAVGMVLRWTYGPAWGAVYGLLRPRLPRRPLEAAAVTSAGIALLELLTFPLIGATPRPRRWPPAHRGALLAHASVFALATALAYSTAVGPDSLSPAPTGAGPALPGSTGTA